MSEIQSWFQLSMTGTAATKPKTLTIEERPPTGKDEHCRNSSHDHYWKPNPCNWYPEDEETS